MNEKNYQKLAELIDRAPRLLGPGGLFGGLNQKHGLMVEFIKFVRGLALGNSMSPETVNIGSFVAYLGERENVKDIARRFYDIRQDGEIGDDPHVKAKNTLFNLAETLIDLGVGEKPENVGGDYEGVLRRAVAQSRSESAVGGRAEAPSEAKTQEPKIEGTASAPHGATLQGTTSEPGRDVASPETPLSTTGEGLTDDISIARAEEAQAGALAIGRAGVSRSEAEARASEASTFQQKKGRAKGGEIAAAPESAQAEEPLKTEGAAPAPGRDATSTEGDLQPGAEEISGDTLGESGLLRPLTAPIIGEAAGQATGEALAGTRVAPGEQRRHIAELPGGRMLRKGPKKHGQGQGREQGRGTGESGQDQRRQTGQGRNPAQDFANQQAAQPQKSRVGRRVAGGAGIAGSLALMKGMYGGAAANAASFGILQTILDLLT